jgi:hypothetical protein
MRRISYKAIVQISNVEVAIIDEFTSEDDQRPCIELAREHIHNRINIPALQVTDAPLEGGKREK